MAQQTTVKLIDDLDGSEARETVHFGLDGKLYEIDLSTPNAARLRKLLGEFVAGARKGGYTRVVAPPVARTAQRTSAQREHSIKVREWATSLGMKVALRGRIPREILEAYDNRDQAVDVLAVDLTGGSETGGNKATSNVTALKFKAKPEPKPVPVTDKMVIEWAKSQGKRTVGVKRAVLRTDYLLAHPGAVLEHALREQA